MPQALPIDWKETERACIAGVPIGQVAKAMAEKAGLPKERVYEAIRQRICRERWPVPGSIVRRAKLQARVAAGQAANAKEAATWKEGEAGAVEAAECRKAAGVPELGQDALSRFETQGRAVSVANSGNGAESGQSLADEGGEALQRAAPLSEELVTADLVQLGQRGLRAILSRSVDAAEAMQAAPEIRSWSDVQTMTKVISQAAGLDKPAVAVAVSLNSAGNATIAGWESIESA